MTLSEYAEVIGSKIEIVGYCDSICAKPRWTVKLHAIEVIEGQMLASIYGSGSTPKEAAADYCRKLQGRPIRRYIHGQPELRTTAFHTLKPY